MNKTKVEETKEPAEAITHQFGVGDEGDLYRVERDFFLDVKLGPLIPVRKGQIVRLSRKSGVEFFCAGKVAPVEIGTVFEAVRDFRTAQNGEWLDVQAGDTLRLERDEALELLRQGMVKQKKGATV